MSIVRLTRTAVACAALATAACASIPADRGYTEVARMAAERGLDAPAPDGDDARIAARSAELVAEPIDAERAIRLALLRHPRMRQLYAELGIAQAEVVEASRLPNPSFGFSHLDPRGGGSALITRSYGLDVAALLLRPARQRLAHAEVEQARFEVAAALMDIARDAERAWFEYVGACQVAEMRRAVAKAADVSARFAQRMHDAGNIDALELALEQAAAQDAALAAAQAEVAVIGARGALAETIGLTAAGDWTALNRLPAPPEAALEGGGLPDAALTQRLDLAAARIEVAARADAADTAARWRLLGDFELGYERESEPDGERVRGPTATIGIPLFDQGQAEVARARFRSEDAQARLASLEARVRNQVAGGIERLETRRRIAERYRDALLPLREAVVARTQEQVNFMFRGVFELILSRREQYDAYQDYLEAVRDYWLARGDLRAAVGGPLPGDDALAEPTLAPDTLLGPPADPDAGHHHHGDTP